MKGPNGMNKRPPRSELTRRSFLSGAISIGAIGASSKLDRETIASTPSSSSVVPQTSRTRGFTLWCASGGLIDPKSSSDQPEVETFVKQCVDVGVTRLIANNASRILVDTARAHGIETHSYVALNSHGGVRMRFAWSCEFIRPPISTPEATAILNTHRPIWSSPNAQPRMSDFARTHQELRGQNRERRDELQPYERLQLSPIFPEMRRHEIGRYLDLLEKSGADGVQAEFVLANEDADGIDTNGYETAMVNAYRAQTGHDPFTLPNNTPDWIQFRADQVTVLLRELRETLRGKNPRSTFTVSLIHRERDGYLKVLQDWPRWVQDDLVDELHLWFRTTSNLKDVEHHTKEAAKIISGRCPLVVELSCYHPGSFQDPTLMLEAARRALTNGADSIGIYRGHAVDQLNFWPVIEKIVSL